MKLSLVEPDGPDVRGHRPRPRSIGVADERDRPASSFCGSYAPGTYTVRTTGFYQIVPRREPPDLRRRQHLPGPARRDPDHARRARHLQGDRYRLVASVTDRRKRGFKPTKSAEVVFQRKVDGVWKRIKGSSAQTTDGLASAVVTVAPGTRVRAVTAHAGYLAGSTSRACPLSIADTPVALRGCEGSARSAA